VSKTSGYLQLRRGIWEHVRNGSLTHTGALVYIYMLTQADTRTGIWKGSAQCIANDLNIPRSTAKYALRGLDGIYIKRFAVPGRHACYPILLHKFRIAQGQHVGLMLDALNSTDAKTLKYMNPEDEPQVVQQVLQDVAPQRRLDTRDIERKQLAAKPDFKPNPEDSVWEFLEISPCGPISFRTLLESRWASQNGEPRSVLIGETVDAWEIAEGEKLRRAAQLFAALAKLRENERLSMHKAAAAEPLNIRKIMPEEIPA